jgi:indole-3-glycerol phosphate synthase
VGTYLDAILATHRAAAATDTRSLDALVDEALGCAPPRGFAAALRATDGLAVIAEVKRRSPSKGPLAVEVDAADLARTYRDGGASCLSVLTDVDAFGGSVDDLVAARDASGLPVIRKDFTVSALDVVDARLMGADCVLLIAAALDDAELADFAELATRLGLDVLVEVHDEAELERAVAAVPQLGCASSTSAAATTGEVTTGEVIVGEVIVGVNQRDLVTFQVDQERAVRVAAAIPDGVLRVAESGVRGRDDAATLAAAGYDAVLVGEHLVTSDDPAGALRSLRVDS